MQAEGIEFEKTTWEEALKKAQEEDKILFVDAYAQWCGPCKTMSRNVFTDDAVGAYYNKNFVNLKLDMDTPDGASFNKKYKVTAYPTLIFLDGSGKLVKKSVGGKKIEDFLDLGELALRSNDKSGEYAEKYDSGVRDFNTVYGYVKALNNVGKPSLKIANEYLSSEHNMSAKQEALFVYESAIEADSRIFDQLIEHKERIIEEVGQEDFEEKVISACKTTLDKGVEYDMKMLYDEALEKCEKAIGKSAAVQNLKFEMDYYHQMRDEEKYLNAAKKLVKKHGKKNTQLYAYVSDDIHEKYKENEKKMALSADYYSKYYKKNKNAESAYFYCRKLILSKDYEKALTVAEEGLGGEKAEKMATRLKSLIQYIEQTQKSEKG